MKKHNILLTMLVFLLAVCASAKDINEARVYINPGHGGWSSNDRPMATINYAVKDTLGFFETNTDLIKAFSVRDQLIKAGVGYVKMSRTKNGIISPTQTPDQPNDEVESATQMVTLSVIREDVEANNMDYFLSIHSNAATEGSQTNYPLLLYRGTDDAPGNGLVNAKQMAIEAWPYVSDNGITYYSAHNSPTSNNNRGDISFMGSSQAIMNNGTSYTGYYGVLLHGCDGFLSEGCFHTYQPERQRLLNDDYCRQEGVRYSRAIRAWFGDTSETKGYIMGTVKNKNKSLEHALYKYRLNSLDAYYPLNEVTVVLQNSEGTEVGRYTTDKEYNGVYVFTDLEPGTYKLVYDIEGYWLEEEELEVVANKTSFINKLLVSTDEEEPTEEVDNEVKYYPHPEQDGDIVSAESYNFTDESKLENLEALEGLTIRRAILKDNKFYVLAVASDQTPKLKVLDAATGALLKDMSTEGIQTVGFEGKSFPLILSDITFTTDGVLLATNSTVIGRPTNAFQTGDFYVYKWQATGSGLVEDATPQVLLTLPTNDNNSLAPAGNNNSNYIANSIAVDGSINKFNLYFDSHAGNAWTTTYGMRYVCWQVENGVVKGTNYKNFGFNETAIGSNLNITLSPLALDRIIIDSDRIEPREFQMDWVSNDGVEVARFSEDIPQTSNGANYFRYTDKIYMSVPVSEAQESVYSFKSHLYDITAGLDKAKAIGITDALITNQPLASYATSVGVVDNADIDQYLFVNSNIGKYTTKGQMAATTHGRIFAFDLEATQVTGGYDISYQLNEDASSVELLILDVDSGEELAVLPFGSQNKGENTISILDSDLPGDLAEAEGSEISYHWAIRASAPNVTRFTKLSDDSNLFKYAAPKGIAIDKSPESDYFGRVYITNMTSGASSGRNTSAGIYILDANQADVTGQGDVPYTGDIAWTATEGPRKVAIADDGRVFICDATAANAGIYLMKPDTYEITSIFPGATNTAGKLTVGGIYVGGQTTAIGVKGLGAETQLYAVDKVASGSTWKKLVNVYNIGEATTWTKAPSYSAAASSYVGNDNSSIAPVSTGYWAGQYRGAGGNTVANPCMFYFSNSHNEAVFNTAEPNLLATSSQNGALAVKEDENVVVLSNNGGVSVFQYKMNKEGIPVVTEKFWNSLGVSSVTYDDFEFDYAGNLYAVSNSGKFVSVWAMPTDNNVSTTAARSTQLLKKGDRGSSIEESEISTSVNVSPNPVIDMVTVESTDVISTLEIYNTSGSLVERKLNVNQKSINLNLSHLSNGVYFVRINNGTATKLIKK